MTGESITFKDGFEGNCIQTLHEISSEQESLNAQLLTRAGFIKQELSGVYSYTTLGYEVLKNIENITRDHMKELGNEIHMPALQPVENWEKTGRLESVSTLFEARGANEVSRKTNSSRYILGPTHEEIVTPLAKMFIRSYRDFPVSLFQFQTKFRNEARSKSGLLRGREFLMKDMYSFHPDEVSLQNFYKRVQDEYVELFYDLGIGEDTFITLASGGDFTTGFSHEFQTLLPMGEDQIYLDRKNRIAYNKEIVNPQNATRLGVDFDKLEKASASEIANIFPLNLKFSTPFDLTYTDKDGSKKPIYMGCYGIGISRLMGVIAEKFADKKGLVWPEKIAPAKFHIITVPSKNSPEIKDLEEMLFSLIGKDSLRDKRFRKSMGEKLSDADLIGCPIRIVISENSLSRGGVEVKQRNQDTVYYMTIGELIDKFGGPRRNNP